MIPEEDSSTPKKVSVSASYSFSNHLTPTYSTHPQMQAAFFVVLQAQ